MLKREKDRQKSLVDTQDGAIQTEDISAIVEALLIKDNLFEKIKCFILELVEEERQRNAIEIKKQVHSRFQALNEAARNQIEPTSKQSKYRPQSTKRKSQQIS